MRVRASNRRIRWTLPLIGLALIVLSARLVQVQWIQRDRFFAHSHQHRTSLTSRATRGAILDRNGKQLAVTRDVYSLCIYPRYYRDLADRSRIDATDIDARKQRLASVLASELGIAKEDLLADISSPKGFAWVRRHIEGAVILRIEQSLKEGGIGWWPRSGLDYVAEETRAYPRGALAAHVPIQIELD